MKIASYVYDAWGNFTKSRPTGVTYGTADTFVYNKNPFTYRGYYYDVDIDMGYYYLQTRYYDPEIGRFINMDAFSDPGAGSLIEYNIYVYVANNPVSNFDSTGQFLLIYLILYTLGLI